MIYLSLVPATFLSEPKSATLLWSEVRGRRQILDALLNVWLYVPLGYLACSLFQSNRAGLVASVILGGLLSGVLETAQLWTDVRMGTYTDWIMNAAGSIVGAALFVLTRKWNRTGQFVLPGATWRLSRTGALFVGLWFLWLGFPFVPELSLSAFLNDLQRATLWTWWGFSGAFVAFCVLRTVVGSSPWLVVAASATLLPVFVANRDLSSSVVVGCFAALWLAPQVRIPLLAQSWLLSIWLVIEELRPFDFSSEMSPMAWVPFSTWFETSQGQFYEVCFAKLFLYGGTVQVSRLAGARTWVTVGVPMTILLGGEWLQRYLPGRTPDTTDPVLLLAALLLIWLCQEERSNHPSTKATEHPETATSP